jgi:hypothetical protein
MATNNSGRDVEKATRINPTVVLPSPVMSAILTELVIVELLALPKMSKATTKAIALPISPSCSNIAIGTCHFFLSSLASFRECLLAILSP